MRLHVVARGKIGRSPEADLLSYLLFDGEFLGPLAELGYRDARSRESEFAAFFSDEPLGSEF